MINKITSGISKAISVEFGDNYEIYKESIEQGLKEPCFSILCINPTNDLFMGKRYFRKNLFCIQYFPATNEKKIECNEVSEKLFNCLEYINVNGDITRGTKMNCEIIDGVLNFFINYDLYVYKVEEKETMGGYDIDTEVERRR